MIAGVAIGMTVDNTIHLVSSFRRAYGESGNERQALASMMGSSGRAVTTATLTAAAGFAMGLFGSFLPTVHFAVLVGAALLLGLLSVMVLLPLSLILVGPLPSARSRTATAVALVLALTGTASAADEIVGQEEIALEDQYGQRYGPTRFEGEVRLLLYGKPNELRKMKSWEVKILGLVEQEVAVLRAVDAREILGKKSKHEVNDRLRQSVPREISILVDWSGVLARLYGLPEGLSATVLSPTGSACGTVAGTAQEASLSEIHAILKSVREQGTCP
jgi:hypothetical protein